MGFGEVEESLTAPLWRVSAHGTSLVDWGAPDENYCQEKTTLDLMVNGGPELMI